MKRKEFLSATLAAVPAFAFSQAKPSPISGSDPFVVRAGESRFHQPMKYQGIHPNDIIISRNDTVNGFSMFSYTGFAKIGPPMHIHLEQDEIFYVVEGRYRFVVGTEKWELQVGDTIFLPRKIPHTWIQLTEKGKLIYAVTPAGSLEDFFKEMNALGKPPTAEEAAAIHRKHGMTVIGPPLSL
jgi:quercetin dioxygenase-like cupin family protein